MADFYTGIYNPDVLACLANLSNDEVFTPPEIANHMIDLLPQDLFSDPNTTFLDPACKSGVFLREIAKRLIDGLEPVIPDLQERLDHIFKKQLFAISITELTSLLSRRSTYCSKYPNSKYSVTTFDNIEGNIRFKKVIHRWDKGRCVFCGASQGEYDRDEKLETHAYEFIHTTKPQEIFNMKFDVIIGNPPYQLATGGGTDEKKSATQAKPIYHTFIEQAKKLNPRYLCMIIPARWYNGGIGLTQFRNDMLADKHISKLYDYINSKDCFQGVDIAGGICVFLRERDNVFPKCEVTNISGDSVTVTERPLDEYGTLFIRANNAIGIINKVRTKSTAFLDEMASSLDTFGIPTNEHGHKVRKDGDVILIHSSGYNDQGESYYERSRITKNVDLIDKWKVKISRMIPQGGEVGIKPENGYRSISTPQVLKPGEVDTFSYFNVGFFDTEEEAENYKCYLQCKFTRFMLRTTYSGVNVSQGNFIFAPKMDFTKKWTDEDLYKYFDLTQEEQELIEKTMRPMD